MLEEEHVARLNRMSLKREWRRPCKALPRFTDFIEGCGGARTVSSTLSRADLPETLSEGLRILFR
jgi:hypothetical protein